MRSTSVQLIQSDPEIVQFQIGKQNWLWLKDAAKQQQRHALSSLAAQSYQVLWWSGQFIEADLLEQLKPQVAIAYGSKVDPRTLKQLQNQQVQVYWTARDGAIRWTPHKQFEKTIEAPETAPPT